MTKQILCALVLVLCAAPAYAQRATSGTLSANGSLVLDVTGMGTVSVSVGGTYSGTNNFEVGNGGAPVSVDCAPPSDPAGTVNSTTSTGAWSCTVAGFTQFIVRMSSYVSGSAVVAIAAAPGGGGSGGGGDVTSNGQNIATETTLSAIEGQLAQDATVASTVPNTGPSPKFAATGDLDAETAVTDDQAAHGRSDLLGRQLINIGCGRENRVNPTPVAITDGSSTSILAAQGAGVIVEVYAIEIANSSGTDVTVDIRDGTAGAVKWTLMAPATSDTGGGNNRVFTIPLTFTANTAVAADPSAAASTITVSLIGCTVK
jgi:hypothetical protein